MENLKTEMEKKNQKKNLKGGQSCPKCNSWISEGEDHCDTCGWPFS